MGVCPTGTIDFSQGKIENVGNKCVECGKCLKACPGGEFDYKHFNKEVFNTSVEDINLDFGFYKSILKVYSNNEKVRDNASSGDLAIELGLFLLEKGYVDSVIGVTCDVMTNKVEAITTKERLLDTMQSKYLYIPVNKIIRHILENDGKYLYVGLPCQIQGLRKAMEQSPVLKNRIVLCAAIFCGFNMTEECTEFLIKKSGIDPSKIKKLEYRGNQKDKTGFKLTSDGKSFFISKHGYTFLNTVYSKERCWKCYDLTGEFADISLGDAREMGNGWSRIIIRSSAAAEIINEMAAEKRITLSDSGEEDIYSSQKKLIAYKKRSIGERKKLLKTFPDYNLDIERPKGLNRIKACLFLMLLKLGKTKIVRGLLNIIPIRLIEKVSEAACSDRIMEIINYGIWGVVTTLVSFFSYTFLVLAGIDYKIANIISMILTKLTAYLSNKHFVFHSKCESNRELIKEITKFVITRGLSGVIEFMGLILLVDICHIDRFVGKALMIVVVTIVNFFFGKFIVYRSKNHKKN